MTPYSGTALTPLIGRDREIRAVESRLAGSSRLITLVGPGGSGKTRLARELFNRRRVHDAATYFVDLVGVLDPGLVPTEIATELGVTETADLNAAGVVTAALCQGAAALFLDNLEELTGARDFLAGLLQAAPSLQIIATSRIPLDIPGEKEFNVAPLEVPGGDDRAEVELSPAGMLFLERARAVGRLDEVDAPNAKAIAELCRRLDGLPLAIELAAARTRILPPASILRHLAEHTSGLLTKANEKDVRHESLDIVLNWSLDLLEANEAEVLSAVAICPGGFDLAIAEVLAPDRNVLQAIDVLATYGLLSLRGADAGEPWYRLLETIRAAVIARAADEDTSERWKRLATHISGRVAATLEAYDRLDMAEFVRLDELLDDVRAVLDWTEVHDPGLNLKIAASFWPHWQTRGRSREGILRLRAAILADPEPNSDLADALHGLAVLERDSGGPTEAGRAAAESARIARIVGQAEREVTALALVVTLTEAPEPEISARLLELEPMIEEARARFYCLDALAVVEGLRWGFSESVITRFQDATAVLASSPYRRLKGISEANLAQIYLYQDQPTKAYDQSQRALSALEDAGPETLSWVHGLRAAAAASRIDLFSEATMSLRLAFQLADSGGTALMAEVMVAAIAVLAISDAPLLAAKVWGAITAGTLFDSLIEADRVLAERPLSAVRRTTDPVAFELAVKEGQNAGAASVRDEVLAHLDLIARPVRRARTNLQHGVLTQRELEVLALAPMTLPPEARLGTIRIERLIGRGGMGEVYLGRDEALDRPVAVKVLPPELAADAGFQHRFVEESRLAASLDHPNILPIYEAGEREGRLVIVMRYVDGEDLGKLIEREGILPPTRSLALLGGIGAALDAAHERGLVHRDVKPSNILVARGDHAYLSDFGLVKQLGSSVDFTQPGGLLGSVGYVAPEQIEGRPVDVRADVYSLACVLHECLTGRPPYSGEREVATLWAHVQAIRPRPSEYDPALAQFDPVIARGMAVDPDERYSSAGELMAAAAGAGSASAPAVVRVERASTAAPVPSASVRTPQPLTGLIGRDAVLAEVAAKVARHRLITLTGPGGTGKSRLAQAVVDAARSEREAFFIDLSTLTEGERMGSALAVSLGITEEGDADAAVSAWARSGRPLLALDNLEQVRGVASPVGRLLDDAPGLSLLATSRGPVGVRGEHEIRIEPLTMPAEGTPEAVEASSSGALFLDRARSLGRLDPPLDVATASDIAALCRRLDGLPLALELAAARTRILSPSAILSKLDERNMGILRRADGEARHRSLDAVLAWSLELLNPDERAVLEACAVCAGTFGLDLLDLILPAADTLTTIESLVAHALVVVDEEVDREPRFRLLETVRLGVLATLGDREDDLRRHHADGAAGIVRRWGPEIDGADIRRAIARLDADLLNVQAALVWTAKREPPLGAEMLLDASRFLLTRGLYSLVEEAIQRFGRTADAEPSLRLPILTVQSSYLTQIGREEEARAATREGVELAREAGRDDLEAELLYNNMVVGIELGIRNAAQFEADAARMGELALSGPRGDYISAMSRTIKASRLDGVDAASRALEAELSTVPDGRHALGAAANLSFFALAAGHLDTAVEAGTRAVRLALDFGDHELEAFARQNVAAALAELGRPDEAREAMTRSIAIAAALGMPLPAMDALRACGTIAAIYGRPREAAWLLGAAQAAYAPTPLADPEDDESSGAGRHWRAARKAIDPIDWEAARREGAEADRQAAFDRALDVVQGNEGTPGSGGANGSRDRLHHPELTRREIEILTLVGEGRSDSEIGERLFISPKTASVHVANVQAKLGAASRLEMALRAREMGLIGSSIGA